MGFVGNNINMGGPAELLGNNDFKVFGLGYLIQNMASKGVKLRVGV